MDKVQNFTEGKIFSPLIRFAVPVLLALFLQATYGAVDLLIVGQFGGDMADVFSGLARNSSGGGYQYHRHDRQTYSDHTVYCHHAFCFPLENIC